MIVTCIDFIKPDCMNISLIKCPLIWKYNFKTQKIFFC